MKSAKDDLATISDWMINPSSVPLDGRIASVLSNISKSDKLKIFKSMFAAHQAKRMSKLVEFLERVEDRMCTHPDLDSMPLEELIVASKSISSTIRDASNYISEVQTQGEINEEATSEILLDQDQRKRVRKVVTRLIDEARGNREQT